MNSTTPRQIISMSSACIANFSLFFCFYLMLPVTVAYLHTKFNAPLTDIGLVLSANMFTAIAVRPFVGYLLWVFNRRVMLVISFAIFTSCFWGYMLAPSLAVFTVFRLLHGVAFSLTAVTLNTMAIDSMPHENRDKWLGYYSVMSNVAMALGPLTTLWFFDQSHDFTHPFLIAMLMGVVGLLAGLFLHDRKNHEPQRFVLSLDRFFLRRGVWIAIVISLVALSYGMLTTYIAAYGNMISGAVSGSGVFFLCFAVSMVLSRILTASFLRRGHVKVLVNSSLAILIVSFGIFVTNANPTTYYLSGMSMGLMYGILAPALQTMISELAPHKRRVTANATYVVSWDFGVGLGVMLGGVLSVDFEGLTGSFEIAALFLVVGLLCFMAIAAPHYLRNRIQ